MNYIFITGTSRGIGKALAEKALEKGFKVFGISRKRSINHTNYQHFTVDLSDLEQLNSFVFPAIEEAKKIVLVNNAGVLGQVAPMGRVENTELYKVFRVNTIAVSYLMNLFIKKYENNPAEKTILNVSSGAGRHVIESWSAYCASKSAMDMLSQVCDFEQKKYFTYPVRVFSVAPGIVDTAMQDEIRKVSEDNFKDVNRFKNYKATNALSSPQSVAADLFKIIDFPENISEVILDVRNFE